MRIAHITDIHVTRIPHLTQMTPKRFLGAANLLIGGRRHHFSRDVQRAMVRDVDALKPDAIVCTGDITQTSIPQEFEDAQRLLSPIFERYPTVLITGNHDAYTRKAWKTDAMETYFAPFMGVGGWPRVHHLSDTLTIVCVNSSRAHMTSSGRVEDAELSQLDRLLSGDQLRDRTVLVALHYPLRGRRGQPYGPPSRALSNASELEAILLKHPNRVDAILHGHEHHGFRTTLAHGEVSIPIFNPGSSGYAWLPEKGRTAHFNIYTVAEKTIDVERFAYCGKDERFVPENGGAYASGG